MYSKFTLILITFLVTRLVVRAAVEVLVSVCRLLIYQYEISPLFCFNKVSRNASSPLLSSSIINLIFWWRLLIWWKKFSNNIMLSKVLRTILLSKTLRTLSLPSKSLYKFLRTSSFCCFFCGLFGFAFFLNSKISTNKWLWTSSASSVVILLLYISLPKALIAEKSWKINAYLFVL